MTWDPQMAIYDIMSERVGVLAETVYYLMSIAGFGLGIICMQQVGLDPHRVKPWCYFKRFGLGVISVLLLASGLQLGPEPTWFRFVGMVGMLSLLTGSVLSRTTSDGTLKTIAQYRHLWPE